MHSLIATETKLAPSFVCSPHLEDSAYHPGQAWYALVIFDIMSLAAGIDIAIVTLLVHPIEVSLRINDMGFAAVVVAYAIGIAMAYYPAGLLADTFRRRDMIAAGAGIWVIAAFIVARTDSETMLLLARWLTGIGVGVLAPSTFSILSDAFPRTRRAFAIGIYSAGTAIGSGVGFTICGALVAATQRNGIVHVGGMFFLPWQQCFVAVTAMGLIALVLVLTVSEPTRKERATHSNVTFKVTILVFGQYLRRHWLLWTLLLAGCSFGLTSPYAIFAWGPAFGLRHYAAGGVSSIALLGFFTAGGPLLGSAVGGLLAQRIVNQGRSRLLPQLLVAAAVISCTFAASFPFMPSWLLAVTGMGGVCMAGASVFFLIQIGIQETAPNEIRGQLLGLFGFSAFIPSSLGVTLVAFLATNVFSKTGGLEPALAVVCGTTSGLAALLYAFSGAPYERAQHELRTLVAQPSTPDNANP